ncbi:MAG TPA: hypothetical protein VKT32_14670, partial [Chthonomonadaceae bacterium]|nr:hypothetical protein [Chthonomonadaceae bacterium]
MEGRYSRRTFLLSLALLGAAGCEDLRKGARSVTGPAPADWSSLPEDAGAVSAAVHVLNRMAFGPRPGDVTRVAAIGAAAYIEEQ